MGRLVRSRKEDGNGSVKLRTEHIYDAYNRLSSQSWVLGTKAYSESYAYSDSEGTDGTITTTATVFVYTYDTAGNICSETKTTGGTATTKAYTYGDGLWKDLLTKVGITPITYDDSGNPLNWYNGKKTFSGLRWEHGRQLARLSVGGTAIHYEYDADGIRT